MARDEHAILGQVQVFLERVGAEVGRQFVGRPGFFGHEAGQATVTDDQGRLTIEGWRDIGGAPRDWRQESRPCEEADEPRCECRLRQCRLLHQMGEA